MECWYALQCRSNQEPLVADKLGYDGIESFYPHRIERIKAPHWRGGEREIERKFFPGYLFARFDYLPQARLVIAVPQVLNILGWGRTPVAIPDCEVEAVRQIVNAPEVSLETVPYVAAGDAVRVKSGPLAGLEGFVAYSKSSARVIVSVTMMRRSISAEVAIADLERMDTRKAA
jgi:transcription antitermination factor NusG